MRRLVLALLVGLGCGSHSKGPTTSELTAPLAVGATAPAVQLTSPSGTTVALGDVLHGHAQTVVVFYRGFY